MIIKKARFNNRPFYYLLVSFIAVLIAYNVYQVIVGRLYVGLITLLILFFLLALILTQHRFGKTAIVVWSIIAFLIGGGFEIVADLFDDVGNSFSTAKLSSYLINLVWVAIGIVIISYAKNTIDIITISEAK